jgi:hypothetical protein
MTGRILPTLAVAFLLIAPVSMTPAAAQAGPPPLASPSTEEPVGASWFAAIDGQSQGPFTEEQIRDRGLAPDTLVWRDGMQDWTTLAQVPELNEVSATVAVVPPPLPRPPEDTTEYFVEENGTPSPAMTREEIARRIAAGSIDGSTLVWHEGMAGWETLDKTQLSSLLSGPSSANRVVHDTPDTPDTLDALDIVIGRWQGRISQPVDGLPTPVDLAITAVFGRDGSFSYSGNGMMDLRSQGVEQPVRLEVAVEGTWQAEAQAPNRVRANLSGTIRMAAPELDMTETEPLVEVITLDIIDRDTIRDDEGNVFSRSPG